MFAVLRELRGRIEAACADNPPFVRGAGEFLVHAKETINPAISGADVREMLIQHILTEDIFARVFNEGEFHRENNVAKALWARKPVLPRRGQEGDAGGAGALLRRDQFGGRAHRQPRR